MARSMSSTVVRSFHPPASLIAEMRHTPAVPGLPKLIRCYERNAQITSGWREHWLLAWFTVESKEGADGGAHFLLHGEVVVQGHLLHPRHQALVRVH